MKITVLVIMVFSAFFPLRGDVEEIKNPDFTDGLNNWEGDGETASVFDEASAPVSLSETAAPKESGVVIKLSHNDWTKIYQTFTPKFIWGTMTIVYKVSPGTTFSTDRESYLNVGDRLDIQGYVPFNLGTGDMVALTINIPKASLCYYDIAMQPGSDTQTFKIAVKRIFKKDDHAIYVAFPPGDGTVTILHAGIENSPAHAK